MNKLSLLQNISNLYKKNINIIEYLKSLNNTNQNSIEDIMISYDFQAGSYVREYNKNPLFKNEFAIKLANIIDSLDGEKNSIFEGGVGEATT